MSKKLSLRLTEGGGIRSTALGIHMRHLFSITIR